MRGSQKKYKKYEKVNTRFLTDPWKTTYFPERNDLGYLKLANGAMCSSKSLSDSNIFHLVLAHKTAFRTELNLLIPFSFGNDNCLIVEIILHFAAGK